MSLNALERLRTILLESDSTDHFVTLLPKMSWFIAALRWSVNCCGVVLFKVPFVFFE